MHIAKKRARREKRVAPYRQRSEATFLLACELCPDFYFASVECKETMFAWATRILTEEEKVPEFLAHRVIVPWLGRTKLEELPIVKSIREIFKREMKTYANPKTTS